jgi:hypothetical protein
VDPVEELGLVDAGVPVAALALLEVQVAGLVVEVTGWSGPRAR